MTDTDIDDIEARLFDAREELVGHAEARGYGNLFSDKQSIGDMREQIQGVEDREVRDLLLQKFAVVEQLYDDYTTALVSDVVREQDD